MTLPLERLLYIFSFGEATCDERKSLQISILNRGALEYPLGLCLVALLGPSFPRRLLNS